MGKNSARSKGYRKTYTKVTGYTETEKKIMTIGFIAIVVILVAVLVLPDWIESFSLLKVKDGIVQGVEENWLIFNKTGSSSNPKYQKLAAINAPEGFEQGESGYITDVNVPYLQFAPTGESAAQTLMAQSGNGEAEELANNYAGMISMYGEILHQGEVVEETINGVKTWSFIAEYRMENLSEDVAAATEGTEEDVEAAEAEVVYDYTQSAICYVDSPIADRCVVLTASNTGSDDTCFADRDAMLEVVRSAVAGIEMFK